MLSEMLKEEIKEENSVAKKRLCMICQPVGIGDILFIQKMTLHCAAMGFRVVVPLMESYAWIRHYLVPHPDIEYPIILTKDGFYTGDFKFADLFMSLSSAAGPNRDISTELFKNPLAYHGGDPDIGFIFLAIGSSYHWRNDPRIMAVKYDFVGLDFSDWAQYVRLQRRQQVELDLYYNVLGLKDDSRYTLVNEACSSHGVPLSVSGNVVHVRKIDGFTMIDWMFVIEKATQIVTIDTSVVILAEIIGQQKPLYMISRYDPPTFEPIQDILKLNWNLILTPEELDVLPVTDDVEDEDFSLSVAVGSR